MSVLILSHALFHPCDVSKHAAKHKPVSVHSLATSGQSLTVVQHTIMDLQTTLGSEPNLGDAERVPVKDSTEI